MKLVFGEFPFAAIDRSFALSSLRTYLVNVTSPLFFRNFAHLLKKNIYSPLRLGMGE